MSLQGLRLARPEARAGGPSREAPGRAARRGNPRAVRRARPQRTAPGPGRRPSARPSDLEDPGPLRLDDQKGEASGQGIKEIVEARLPARQDLRQAIGREGIALGRIGFEDDVADEDQARRSGGDDADDRLGMGPERDRPDQPAPPSEPRRNGLGAGGRVVTGQGHEAEAIEHVAKADERGLRLGPRALCDPGLDPVEAVRRPAMRFHDRGARPRGL